MSDHRPLWDTWPQDVLWQPVSPRLVRARIVGLLLAGVPLLALAGFLSWLWWGPLWMYLIGGAGLVFLAARTGLTSRAVRAWGYSERDDDLLIRHGLWTKRLSIVPYGRMQFIDISANPLERIFDLASVKLHTAAASSDSSVPGLAPEVAAGLRDRLAERAKAEREGL